MSGGEHWFRATAAIRRWHETGDIIDCIGAIAAYEGACAIDARASAGDIRRGDDSDSIPGGRGGPHPGPIEPGG